LVNDSQAERDLTTWLSRGDPAAVEELFARYFRQVYSVVYHAVGRDRTTAEDITQDTFLSAARAAGRFRGQSKPYTWLLGIAHHKISDYYRKKGRSRRYEIRSLEAADSKSEILPDNSNPIQERLESAETGALVTRVLGELPYHYRTVLIYKYVEEMSVKEISEVMKRSPKSVEALLTRARSILKKEMEDLSEGKKE
jgi:RNA polymerase sigma-70 factor (ECF subfamily)